MPLEHVTSISTELNRHVLWLWCSAATRSFVFGDERRAFALPFFDLENPRLLDPARPHDPTSPFHHPCNLPIPDDLYDEFRRTGWRGFEFLEAEAYDRAVDRDGNPVGDLVRTLTCGPDYGHYVLHPATGTILGLRSGSLDLLRRDTKGFTSLAKAKTRGRVALCFAAHPKEGLSVYGDNFGDLFAQRFTSEGFEGTRKIDSTEHASRAVEFVDGGRALLFGRQGALTAYSYDGGKFGSPRVFVGEIAALRRWRED